MNGAEHYRQAEHLLANAAEVVSRFAELADGVRDAEVGNATRILTAAIAQSQAHATLALAAATAATFLGEFIELEDEAAAWAKATA